jgi:RimJ/RimL family protein N-acetyltransferase
VKNIDLESPRLLYRRVTAAHITTEYVSWINDEDVNMYLETRGNYTLSLLKSYIEEQLKNDVYFWAIHLKESDKHIGNIKIDPIHKDLKAGEYGILMGDKSTWGKGYAKEATVRVLEYCFKELMLSEVTLGVVEDNKKAVSLYKNIGFSLVEIRKDVGKYNYKLSNTLRMSVHVEDFK